VLSKWQLDCESRPFTAGAFDSDLALMSLDDFATGREPDAGTFELGSAMKPLENSEDTLGVFHLKADAVVSNRNPTAALAELRT